MKKMLIMFLLSGLMLTPIVARANAEDKIQIENGTNQMLHPFGFDHFFQSNDDIFNQIRAMHREMDKLMQHQFSQIHNTPFNFIGSKNILDSTQGIQMEEHNNELIYRIKKPEGADSKIDISVKDGILFINTCIMQKIKHEDDNSKRYSYSQQNYNQSFKLPIEYDPKSIDIKTKDSHLIVRFKKKDEPHSLKSRTTI